MDSRTLVVGGAGFIGSNLAARLAAQGQSLLVADDLSLGRRELLAGLPPSLVTFVECDFSDSKQAQEVFDSYEIDCVYHLAANSDIRRSATDPDVDYRNTFMTTLNVLRGMRTHGIRRLVFASTSAVYGDTGGSKVDEDYGPLLPASYYGGAKLASEGFISAYAQMNDLQVWICRFPNVVGEHGTHGIIHDFIRKLRNDPKRLEILGDGSQRKPYIYVQDLLDAILLVVEKASLSINVFNIGVDDQLSVSEIADIVCAEMGLKEVEFQYTGGKVGWKGDVARYMYDSSKLRALGWRPRHNSREAVVAATRKLLAE